MKVLSKVFTVIVSAMLLTATSAYAEHHGSKGMNVPKIGSMVVMSGL